MQAAPRVVCARRSVAVKADGAFIGSSTNFIVCLSTVAFLGAGRFGFAPSVAKVSTAGLKLVDRDIPLKSNDPAGTPLGRHPIMCACSSLGLHHDCVASFRRACMRGVLLLAHAQ